MTGPDAAVRGQPSPVMRAAAGLYLVAGPGSGTGALATLAALARDGELPMIRIDRRFCWPA